MLVKTALAANQESVGCYWLSLRYLLSVVVGCCSLLFVAVNSVLLFVGCFLAVVCAHKAKRHSFNWTSTHPYTLHCSILQRKALPLQIDLELRPCVDAKIDRKVEFQRTLAFGKAVNVMIAWCFCHVFSFMSESVGRRISSLQIFCATFGQGWCFENRNSFGINVIIIVNFVRYSSWWRSLWLLIWFVIFALQYHHPHCLHSSRMGYSSRLRRNHQDPHSHF